MKKTWLMFCSALLVATAAFGNVKQWPANGAGGGGTVTSVGCSGLSPLFTCTVDTATTTPQLVFALDNVAANAFCGGPASGSPAALDCRALVAADIPIILDTGIQLSTPLGGQTYLSSFLALDRSYWTEYTCDTPLVCTFGTNATTGNQTLELSTSGNFVQTQVVAAGASSFTTSSRTHTIHFRLQAAGGGGGGVASNAASNGDVGGGGSAGGYCEASATVTPSTAYTVSLPVGGTGGANTGANGNAPSGDSTVTIGATTYTAKAGNGGLFTASGATLALVSGGANTAVSTNCDVNAAGAPGDWGIILASGAGGRAGQGGSSSFGGGGSTRGTTGAGNSATGYGSGGAGALSGSSGSGQTGGNGGDSVLIVDEYQ